MNTMYKEVRKIKPYPAIVPDDIRDDPIDVKALSWMLKAAATLLVVMVLMLAGVAVHMWSLIL